MMQTLLYICAVPQVKPLIVKIGNSVLVFISGSQREIKLCYFLVVLIYLRVVFLVFAKARWKDLSNGSPSITCLYA